MISRNSPTQPSASLAVVFAQTADACTSAVFSRGERRPTSVRDSSERRLLPFAQPRALTTATSSRESWLLPRKPRGLISEIA